MVSIPRRREPKRPQSLQLPSAEGLLNAELAFSLLLEMTPPQRSHSERRKEGKRELNPSLKVEKTQGCTRNFTHSDQRPASLTPIGGGKGRKEERRRGGTDAPVVAWDKNCQHNFLPLHLPTRFLRETPFPAMIRPRRPRRCHRTKNV